MKKFGTTLAGWLLIMVCVAQVPDPLQFREETFDFGTIEENRGKVIHEFVFTNTTDRPIRILNVRASCGCTTPAWTKEPVMPGKTGFIQAEYNPQGRPGFFNKSLTVTTDVDSNPITLQIKGSVNAERAVVTNDYSLPVGSWKLKSTSFNLGKVFIKDEYVMREFRYVNSSHKPVTITGTDAPAHLHVVVEPATVAAGETGSIRIGYNGKLKNEYGFQSDNITLHTDDEAQPDKQFAVLATLEDYFPVLTPVEQGKAPHLALGATTLDFGRVQQNKEVTQKTTITNTGKTPLTIRSLQGNCTCVQVKADKTTLKPGESTAITITFNPQNRKGTQQKAVTVYSSDPQNPVQRITLAAYVE